MVAFDNKTNEWCVMQGWNSECERKVKKQKYLKYKQVCCVKFWCVKWDWLMHALNNKIKYQYEMQVWKQWVQKKSK
jgi:hypothetical protein